MNEKEKKNRVAALIDRLVSGNETEEEDLKIHEEISQLVTDPEWSDYVFYSEEFYKENGSLNTQAVVDKIFSYKPICL